MSVVTARIPDALDKDLTEVAKSMERSKNFIILKAIQNYSHKISVVTSTLIIFIETDGQKLNGFYTLITKTKQIEYIDLTENNNDSIKLKVKNNSKQPENSR